MNATILLAPAALLRGMPNSYGNIFVRYSLLDSFTYLRKLVSNPSSQPSKPVNQADSIDGIGPRALDASQGSHPTEFESLAVPAIVQWQLTIVKVSFTALSTPSDMSCSYISIPNGATSAKLAEAKIQTHLPPRYRARSTTARYLSFRGMRMELSWRMECLRIWDKYLGLRMWSSGPWLVVVSSCSQPRWKSSSISSICGT